MNLLLIASAALASASAPLSLNDCGGIGDWCIDSEVGVEVAEGYVAYMTDRGSEAPGRFYAVLQIGGEADLSLTVGVWGCRFQGGEHIEAADREALSLPERIGQALASLDRALVSVGRTCNADPSTFSKQRETFNLAYRLFEEGRPTKIPK